MPHLDATPQYRLYLTPDELVLVSKGLSGSLMNPAERRDALVLNAKIQDMRAKVTAQAASQAAAAARTAGAVLSVFYENNPQEEEEKPVPDCGGAPCPP